MSGYRSRSDSRRGRGRPSRGGHARNYNYQYGDYNQKYNYYDNRGYNNYDYNYNYAHGYNNHGYDNHGYVNHGYNTNRQSQYPQHQQPQRVNVTTAEAIKNPKTENLSGLNEANVPNHHRIEKDETKTEHFEPKNAILNGLFERKSKIEEFQNKVQKPKKSLMKFKKKKTNKVNNQEVKNALSFDDDDDDANIEHYHATASGGDDNTAAGSNDSYNNKSARMNDNKSMGDISVHDDIDLLLDKMSSDVGQKKISIQESDDERVAVNDDISLPVKPKRDIPYHEPSNIPFVKKFYNECEEIKNIPESEINAFRISNGIYVKNSNIRPIFQWSQLGIPSIIYDTLMLLGYDKPSPIQSESLPKIMSGSDFIGIAKTGSGKTISFLLPLFRLLFGNKSDKISGFSEPRAIIITPTRELTVQIGKTCRPFTDAMALKVVKCYGGQSISVQIGELKKGCDVVIGTPGRIIDLLCSNNGKILNLSKIQYFVMDEADRMFDLGFEPQIEKIVEQCRPERQNVLFSATFPNKMQWLARRMTNNPIEVTIGSKNVVNEDIEQSFEVIQENGDKFNKLLEILGQHYHDGNKILIFVERQSTCDSIVKKMIKRGYPVMSLHGGKEQHERDGIIKDFRSGVIDIIIATSVAARGLDVQDLNLVVNFDSPSHLEDYVHRVGRTGRAGKKGLAITLLERDDRVLPDLVKMLKKSGKDVPLEVMELYNEVENQNTINNDSTTNHATTNQHRKKFSGYSGHGLEQLQQRREVQNNAERKAFAVNEDDDDGGAGDGEANSFGEDLKINVHTGSGESNMFRIERPTPEEAQVSLVGLSPDTRRLVTSPETVSQLSEMGVTVAVRGSASKGDLHLYMEGSAVGVDRGVVFIRREVSRSLEEANGVTRKGGKYSVV